MSVEVSKISDLDLSSRNRDCVYVYPDLNVFRLLDLQTKFWGSAVFRTFEEIELAGSSSITILGSLSRG